MRKINVFIMCFAFAGILTMGNVKPVLANGTSTDVTWNVEGSTLYLDGTGDMADYSQGEDQPWIGFKDVIRKVIIGDQVTSIGDRAFEGYSNITEVEFSESVLTIGKYSFADTAIVNVVIPENIEAVEEGAFYNCESMYDITFEGSYTEILGGHKTIPFSAQINGYYGTYSQRYSEDYQRSYGDLGPGLMVDIAGFQISTQSKGVRTMYSTNIPERDVTEVGIIYGLPFNGKDAQEDIDYKYTEIDDMVIGSDNFFVHDYAATEKGISAKIYSDFEDTRSYIMTMKFGHDNEQYYKAQYYVRAYVKLKTGRIVYSRVYQYSVFDVAETLYTCHQMNSETDHDFLYNILSTVKPEYEKVDWKWDMSAHYGGDVYSGYDYQYYTRVNLEGFQVSSSVNGVRTLYSVSYSDEEVESTGILYGVTSQIQNIGEEMVVGSTNCNVHAYETTDSGRVDIASIGNQLYTMTMLYDKCSVDALTMQYYVRAYAKLTDGTYVYSNVKAYSPYEVADVLYQRSEMYSPADHVYIYENILKKVDPDYAEIEYNWFYMITNNTGLFRPTLGPTLS